MLAAWLYAAGCGGVDVFGAEAQADDAGGNAAEDGEVSCGWGMCGDLDSVEMGVERRRG